MSKLVDTHQRSPPLPETADSDSYVVLEFVFPFPRSTNLSLFALTLPPVIVYHDQMTSRKTHTSYVTACVSLAAYELRLHTDWFCGRRSVCTCIRAPPPLLCPILRFA